MSVWKELELYLRDPSKFKYDKDGSDEFAEILKKHFADDEDKAKQFLEDLQQVEQNATVKKEGN